MIQCFDNSEGKQMQMNEPNQYYRQWADCIAHHWSEPGENGSRDT